MGFLGSNGCSGGRALWSAGPPGKEEEVRVSLRTVRLNSGGYDSRGQYFGVGPTVYAVVVDGDEVGHVRAKGSYETRERVLERVGHAINVYGTKSAKHMWG